MGGGLVRRLDIEFGDCCEWSDLGLESGDPRRRCGLPTREVDVASRARRRPWGEVRFAAHPARRKGTSSWRWGMRRRSRSASGTGRRGATQLADPDQRPVTRAALGDDEQVDGAVEEVGCVFLDSKHERSVGCPPDPRLSPFSKASVAHPRFPGGIGGGRIACERHHEPLPAAAEQNRSTSLRDRERQRRGAATSQGFHPGRAGTARVRRASKRSMRSRISAGKRPRPGMSGRQVPLTALSSSSGIGE